MNPSTAKAFNAMKQKIKKVTKQYETDIDAFRKSPVEEDESEEEAEELARKMEESEDEAEKAVAAKKAVSKDQTVTEAGFSVVGKQGKVVAPEAMNSEDVLKKLDEVLDARGKKVRTVAICFNDTY
jgi:translation initiation factor 3 subunit C